MDTGNVLASGQALVRINRTSQIAKEFRMPSNRGFVYLRPGEVEVRKIDFPTFHNPAGKEIDHGVILKGPVDQHLWLRSAHGPRIVNVKVISLDEAPEGYRRFDAGVPNKFLIDPHGQLPRAA
jgi:hypothetical protein